eukprot:4316719-Pyramimonas_sp.AAC.1
MGRAQQRRNDPGGRDQARAEAAPLAIRSELVYLKEATPKEKSDAVRDGGGGHEDGGERRDRSCAAREQPGASADGGGREDAGEPRQPEQRSLSSPDATSFSGILE